MVIEESGRRARMEVTSDEARCLAHQRAPAKVLSCLRYRLRLLERGQPFLNAAWMIRSTLSPISGAPVVKPQSFRLKEPDTVKPAM